MCLEGALEETCLPSVLAGQREKTRLAPPPTLGTPPAPSSLEEEVLT